MACVRSFHQCKTRDSCATKWRNLIECTCVTALKRPTSCNWQLLDRVVVFLPRRQDCVSGRPVPVPGSSGYLASLSTGETGCGATDTAWLVDAGPGQTVVISMFDFSVSRHSGILANSTLTHRHRVRIYQLVANCTFSVVQCLELIATVNFSSITAF